MDEPFFSPGSLNCGNENDLLKIFLFIDNLIFLQTLSLMHQVLDGCRVDSYISVIYSR